MGEVNIFVLVSFVLLVVSSFAAMAIVSASSNTNNCQLSASLINQDPYPAIPGDYVKLVFQITGVSDPACGKVSVELLDQYPISFDSETTNKIEIDSGVYAQDFSNYLIAPFKVRVDKNALKGNSTIKLKYASDADTGSPYIVKDFDLEVKEVQTDFEVSVKDYNAATNIITFDILNVGKSNVNALVADVPVQNNLDVKGARRNIIGSLDSNDDTTFTFEGTPKDGQISMVILYNDATGTRRQVEQSVMFNSADFKGLVRDKKSYSGVVWVVILIIVGLIIYFWRRNKKKKDLLRRKF
jgi:hypothetical protein